MDCFVLVACEVPPLGMAATNADRIEAEVFEAAGQSKSVKRRAEEGSLGMNWCEHENHESRAPQAIRMGMDKEDPCNLSGQELQHFRFPQFPQAPEACRAPLMPDDTSVFGTEAAKRLAP